MAEPTTAILLAAGSGQRFGTAIPKQFIELCGVPVYERSRRALEESGLFEKIVVATPDHLGGITRLHTVQNALEEVGTPWVVVHDAARPFVPAQILRSLLDALADGADAAGPAMPQTETVIRVDDDGRMVGTIARDYCILSQTPQAFRTGWLRAGITNIMKEGAYTSELLELVRSNGGVVKIVEGSPWLLKITHKPDIYAAKGWLIEETGRVAVVTGGSRGIGKATADYLRDHGYTVYDFSRTSGTHIGRLSDVKRSFEIVMEREGHIDCLVHCAAVARGFRLDEISKHWVDAAVMIETNVNGTLYVLSTAQRYMKPGSVIVNVASSGIDGREGQGVYGATKAASLHLSTVLAKELRDRGITVFTVCPRRTATKLRRDLVGDGDTSSELLPKDVGNFIGGLCVDAPHALTGQVFYFPAMRSDL